MAHESVTRAHAHSLPGRFQRDDGSEPYRRTEAWRPMGRTVANSDLILPRSGNHFQPWMFCLLSFGFAGSVKKLAWGFYPSWPDARPLAGQEP